MPGNRDGPLNGPRQSPSRIREVYDEIGPHFAKTRDYPWPQIEAFLAEHSSGRVGLDVGCGNGRHTALLGETVEQALGIDLSRTLLEEAAKRADHEGWSAAFLQSDAGVLPLGADLVDTGLYVATIHHLASRGDRVASLDELGRVLSRDGRALVSAWSTEHDRFDTRPDAETGFDATVDWTLPGGETVPRFYHIYAPGELADEVADSQLRLTETYREAGNCFVEVSGPARKGKRS